MADLVDPRDARHAPLRISPFDRDRTMLAAQRAHAQAAEGRMLWLTRP
jgi:hypothetical protein